MNIYKLSPGPLLCQVFSTMVTLILERVKHTDHTPWETAPGAWPRGGLQEEPARETISQGNGLREWAQGQPGATVRYRGGGHKASGTTEICYLLIRSFSGFESQ